MITIYTGNNCPRCVEVKDYLKSKSVEFKEINAHNDNHARAFLVEQGFKSIPQVFDEETYVCGYEKYKEKL